MTGVAVLDVGKTNVKLNLCDANGAIWETLSTPNPSRPGPPYRHHDVSALEDWVIEGLRALAARYGIAAVVACGHGSGGVLVDAVGPVMPMIDYEQDIPPAIAARYRAIADSYAERGSPVMLGAAHLARQMLWLASEFPDAFARARWFLPLPQYWAWRLCDVAATEVTGLAAQSHLWDARAGRFAPIVAAQGWTRLMPPVTPAWARLGALRPEVAARVGAGPVDVLCGVHDSSVNFYRYQAAGLTGLTVVSTGTWVVALSDEADPARLDERRGMACNADVYGHPLAGALTMAGREFAAIAGDADDAPVSPAVIARLVAAGTIALPSFGRDDGLFPGSAGRGRIIGPAPADAVERRALATLTVAMLMATCLEALGGTGRVVLDGPSARDPIYPALVAALCPGREVSRNLESYGTATGTSLLASHATRTVPVPIALEPAAPLILPGLAEYHTRWRRQAETHSMTESMA